MPFSVAALKIVSYFPPPEMSVELHQQHVHTLRSCIASRDYLAALDETKRHNQLTASLHAEALSQIRRGHSIEAHRLNIARDLALQKIKRDGADRVNALGADLDRRFVDLINVHDDKLHIYRKLVSEREEKRPVVLSPYVATLRQSEVQLAALHHFDEAHMAQRKLLEMESAERQRIHRLRERRIERAVEVKRHQFEDEQRTQFTKMKNVLRIAKDKSKEELKRTTMLFDHAARDMSHAQGREMQLNAHSTTVVELEAGQRGPCERGTTFLRRMQGNRFSIPSLCDLYGGSVGVAGGSGGENSAARSHTGSS